MYVAPFPLDVMRKPDLDDPRNVKIGVLPAGYLTEVAPLRKLGESSHTFLLPERMSSNYQDPHPSLHGSEYTGTVFIGWGWVSRQTLVACSRDDFRMTRSLDRYRQDLEFNQDARCVLASYSTLESQLSLEALPTTWDSPSGHGKAPLATQTLPSPPQTNGTMLTSVAKAQSPAQPPVDTATPARDAPNDVERSDGETLDKVDDPTPPDTEVQSIPNANRTIDDPKPEGATTATGQFRISKVFILTEPIATLMNPAFHGGAPPNRLQPSLSVQTALSFPMESSHPYRCKSIDEVSATAANHFQRLPNMADVGQLLVLGTSVLSTNPPIHRAPMPSAGAGGVANISMSGTGSGSLVLPVRKEGTPSASLLERRNSLSSLEIEIFEIHRALMLGKARSRSVPASVQSPQEGSGSPDTRSSKEPSPKEGSLSRRSRSSVHSSSNYSHAQGLAAERGGTARSTTTRSQRGTYSDSGKERGGSGTSPPMVPGSPQPQLILDGDSATALRFPVVPIVIGKGASATVSLGFLRPTSIPAVPSPFPANASGLGNPHDLNGTTRTSQSMPSSLPSVGSPLPADRDRAGKAGNGGLPTVTLMDQLSALVRDLPAELADSRYNHWGGGGGGAHGDEGVPDYCESQEEVLEDDDGPRTPTALTRRTSTAGFGSSILSTPSVSCGAAARSKQFKSTSAQQAGFLESLAASCHLTTAEAAASALGFVGPNGPGTPYGLWTASNGLLPVAVKSMIIPPMEQSRYASLVHEVETMRKCDHPNIVRFFGAFKEEKSRVALAMEFCDGGTLEDLINQHAPLEEWECSSILRCILFALFYLHHHLQLIHRDVKPCNVLLKLDGSVKLADMGVVKARKSAATFCGTDAYIAPEVYKGQAYDEKVDLYSLGVVLQYMLTGEQNALGMKWVTAEEHKQVLEARRKLEEERRRQVQQTSSSASHSSKTKRRTPSSTSRESADSSKAFTKSSSSLGSGVAAPQPSRGLLNHRSASEKSASRNGTAAAMVGSKLPSTSSRPSNPISAATPMKSIDTNTEEAVYIIPKRMELFLSREAVDLVNGLVQQDPKKRFGVYEALASPFMMRYQQSFTTDFLQSLCESSILANLNASSSVGAGERSHLMELLASPKSSLSVAQSPGGLAEAAEGGKERGDPPQARSPSVHAPASPLSTRIREGSSAGATRASSARGPSSTFPREHSPQMQGPHKTPSIFRPSSTQGLRGGTASSTLKVVKDSLTRQNTAPQESAKPSLAQFQRQSTAVSTVQAKTNAIPLRRAPSGADRVVPETARPTRIQNPASTVPQPVSTAATAAQNPRNRLTVTTNPAGSGERQPSKGSTDHPLVPAVASVQAAAPALRPALADRERKPLKTGQKVLSVRIATEPPQVIPPSKASFTSSHPSASQFSDRDPIESFKAHATGASANSTTSPLSPVKFRGPGTSLLLVRQPAQAPVVSKASPPQMESLPIPSHHSNTTAVPRGPEPTATSDLVPVVERGANESWIGEPSRDNVLSNELRENGFDGSEMVSLNELWERRAQRRKESTSLKKGTGSDTGAGVPHALPSTPLSPEPRMPSDSMGLPSESAAEDRTGGEASPNLFRRRGAALNDNQLNAFSPSSIDPLSPSRPTVQSSSSPPNPVSVVLSDFTETPLTPPTRESTTQPQLGLRGPYSTEPGVSPIILHSDGPEGLPLVSALTTSVEATPHFRGGVPRVAPPASTLTQRHRSESLDGPGHQKAPWMETLASPGSTRYTTAAATAGNTGSGEPALAALHPVPPTGSPYHQPPVAVAATTPNPNPQPSHQPSTGSLVAVG